MPLLNVISNSYRRLPAVAGESFVPMAGSIKSILNGVVGISVVLWLLKVFGIFHSLSRVRVG